MKRDYFSLVLRSESSIWLIPYSWIWWVQTKYFNLNVFGNCISTLKIWNTIKGCSSSRLHLVLWSCKNQNHFPFSGFEIYCMPKSYLSSFYRRQILLEMDQQKSNYSFLLYLKFVVKFVCSIVDYFYSFFLSLFPGRYCMEKIPIPIWLFLTQTQKPLVIPRTSERDDQKLLVFVTAFNFLW